ncbi:RNase P modulator RnpM [Pueribacillus sp. YX66]|uniref:RNase P modulator RnpM n=1 Tax=Pueribacillus sp. YX66 TaxID=3229242 RepID=UPI0036D3ED7E
MYVKKRKIPLRKCVVTQEMKPKKELFRIVRSPEGDIFIDETGKRSGRGAYVSKDEKVIKLAKEKNSLSSHLKANVSASIYDELLELVEKERSSS